MRVSQVAPARSVYYDRNPNNALTSFALYNAAPHTPTLRFTYTVPVGKKLHFDRVYAYVARSGAASTPGQQRMYMSIQPVGGIEIIVVDIQSYSALVNDKHEKEVLGLGILLAGDTLRFYTSDNSVGGTGDYSASMMFFLFDA